MLFLVLGATLLILIPLTLIAIDFVSIFMARDYLQAAADAAALAAAKDLSRIVIMDPNVGYISLSNYPPVGKALVATDGEPLPVYSYNDLAGTARLDLQFAQDIGSSSLIELSKHEAANVLFAGQKLSDSLRDALARGSAAKQIDNDGVVVDPKQSIEQIARRNLLHKQYLTVENISSSIGAADDAVGSLVPDLTDKNENAEGVQGNGFYKPFINMPLAGQEFFLVGVAPNVHLIKPEKFYIPHTNTPVSIVCVRIDAQVSSPIAAEWLPKAEISVSSCAAPRYVRNIVPAGNLVINLYRTPPSNLNSLGNLFDSSAMASISMGASVAKEGDYPNDSGSYLEPIDFRAAGLETANPINPITVSLYCWLRNLGPNVNLPSFRQLLSTRFSDLIGSQSTFPTTIIFELKTTGDVTARKLVNSPFPIETVADGQLFGEGKLSTEGTTVSLKVFNQILHAPNFLTTKHGGQPLAAEPLNWCDLEYFGRSEADAFQYGRGSKYLNIKLFGENHVSQSILGAISLQFAEYVSEDGRKTKVSPRKSYYGSGLACDISIF
jgi:hypothetical protein